MRILQLHNEHNAEGGATDVMEHERTMLAGAGHEVDRYVTSAASETEMSALRSGAKAVWNVEAARAVRARIDSFHPDVVHVHTPFPVMSPAVFRAAHARGVPAITTLHSYRYSCVVGTCVRNEQICEDCVGTRLKLPGVRHGCYHNSRPASAALTLSLAVHRATGTFSRAVTRYLALTEFSRQLLIRDGYPADRIVVKPNSVADPGFVDKRPSDVRRLVFAGRLVDVKGVRTLLDAWAAVAPGMTLTIAGDGPLRPLVEERAASDPSIDFRGWVSQSEVVDLLRSAEASIVPSHWYEGLPLVILRSLAVGTPVVVSDLDNLSAEALQDGVAWSFRTADPASLASVLNQLRDNPSMARSHQARARQSYEARFSPDVDLPRLEEIYREVIAERVPS